VPDLFFTQRHYGKNFLIYDNSIDEKHLRVGRATARPDSKYREVPTMFQMPPIPTWSGFHPLIVHFPIVLLMIAPLFVVLALLFTSRRQCFLIVAAILMTLGTASSYVSVASGEAAGAVADRTPEINPVLQHHQQLADKVRSSFSVLTVLFLGFLVIPMALRKELSTKVVWGFLLVFLAVYGLGIALLSNTAHQGGRLVHEFGVQSLMPSSEEGSDKEHP
jgi:uncharacterized membrane protein